MFMSARLSFRVLVILNSDLEMVWNKIKEYQQEGLSWGESFKLEPVAYGIKKLVMTVTIVDSLVVLDDITENIEVDLIYACMYVIRS